MIGEQIKKYRKKEGMSQEELANRLNVSRQTISKYESNMSLPDINKIIELAKIFHISLNEFLMIEDDTPMDVNQIQAMVEQLVYLQNQQDKKRKNLYIIVGALFSVLFLAIVGLCVFFNVQFQNVNKSISNIQQNVIYSYDENENKFTYLNSLDTKVVSFNGDGTYTLHVSVSLKEYDDNTEVTFITKQGDKNRETKLDRKDNMYSGAIVLSILSSIDDAQVNIKNNDKNQNEIVRDYIEDYYSSYNVNYGFDMNDDNFDFDNNSGIIMFNINTDGLNIEINGKEYNVLLAKIKVIAKMNDKTIGEFEKEESSGSDMLSVDIPIDTISVEDTLKLEFVIYDTLGKEYNDSQEFMYQKTYMSAGNGDKYFKAL